MLYFTILSFTAYAYFGVEGIMLLLSGGGIGVIIGCLLNDEEVFR